MQEILKGVSTSFQKPFTYRTVCYHRAVTMKSGQFRTIPGVIDPSKLQRWTGGSIGRCHVCDSDAIAWQDPDDHLGSARPVTLISVTRPGEGMITQMAVDRSPVFRGIFYAHTLGQCPLHRWQMNSLSCDQYHLVRGLVYGGLT